METRIIQCPQGKVIGQVREKCVTYTSVPYAITERFESPKSIEPWEIFDATKKPLNCHQRFEYVDEAHEENNFYYREFDFLRNSDYCESPMTLTIITPKEEIKNCPVILYMHGGSFENGDSEDEPFGTCYEYAQRGIILVSVGYRLNVFGLFDSENYGLQDMIFAAKWVQKNIESFGGNPENMILMGQSAGAMCIHDLLLSKQLDGVIQGAIMMSGAGCLPKMAGPDTKEHNHPFWQEVIKAAGCETIEQLKQVDAEKLWWAWYNTKQKEGNFHVSVPSIDGNTIPKQPGEIMKNNEYLDVPIMMSVTSQDMFPALILDLGLNLAKRKVKNNSSPVYAYYFDVTPPGNVFEAFHASDLWYMFGNMELSWRPFDDSDRKISKRMIDYVANFARYYNPNGKGKETWKPIEQYNPVFRLFSRGNRQYIRPRLARGKLYYNMLFKKGPF